MSTTFSAIHFKEKYIRPTDLRALKLFHELEPSLTEAAAFILAVLAILRTQGDIRIPFNEKIIDSIRNHFPNIHLQEKDYLKNFHPGIREILTGRYPSLIGSSQNTHVPFILNENHLYIQKYFNPKQIIDQKISILFPSILNREINHEKIKHLIKQYSLAEKQAEAVFLGASQNLIITGGPGTGKTTVIFHILRKILEKNPLTEIHLAATSGKAAHRMQESILNSIEKFEIDFPGKERLSQIKGETIHRLLQFHHQNSLNRFYFNEQNQFPEGHVFVIDEASMIDIEIFANLLAAIPENSHLFLIGDENQLPSVNAGAVLGDILSEVPKNNTVRLNQSFRSVKEILNLAEQINRGEYKEPVWNSDFSLMNSNQDFPILFFENSKSNNKVPYFCRLWVEKYYSKLNESIRNFEETQLINNLSVISKENKIPFSLCEQIFKHTETARILCLEKKGQQGMEQINQLIEKLLGNSILMVSQNLYHLNLYNGDTGIHLPLLNKVLFKRAETYELISENEFDEKNIEPAFAITVHKSQGSEFDHIALILPENPESPLLSRQILYTGITRAKKSGIILGDSLSFAQGINRKVKRNTGILEKQ